MIAFSKIVNLSGSTQSHRAIGNFFLMFKAIGLLLMSTLCWRNDEKKEHGCMYFNLKGGKFQMSEPQENLEDQKAKIIAQTAELSRLLGMIPSDSTIDVHEPMTHNTMAL